MDPQEEEIDGRGNARPFLTRRSPILDNPSRAMDAGGEQLICEEDSIVFVLIDRAKRPRNAPAYSAADGCGRRSLAEFFVWEAEALHANAGDYQKPEDVPFFPQDLPPPLFPTKGYPKVLHPFASSVCVNDAIWKMYFNELLPLFTANGDDGNYVETVALDFPCLQLAKNLHLDANKGDADAELKFQEVQRAYETLKDKQRRLLYDQIPIKPL